MRLVVEHPQWGLFIGLSPHTDKMLWTKKASDGFRCATVYSFDDVHTIHEAFTNRMEPEDLAALTVHPYEGPGVHVDLIHLARMNISDDRVKSLLYFEIPHGRC